MSKASEPDNVGRSRLLRSAGVVGTWTLMSRVLGLLRDMLMAGTFGTGLVMSAFSVAFRVPNLFRRLFGEGALSAAFVPVFLETREKEGDEAAWRLGAKVFWLLAIGLAVVVVLLEVGIVAALAGWPLSEKNRLLLKLARIMLPYTVFICLVAQCMGMFNAHRHFALPAATPCILNLVWIASLFVLVPFFDPPIFGLAWGILIAGVIQLSVQFPLLRRKGFRFRVRPDWRDPAVRRIVLLMLPAAGAAALTQVNVLIDMMLAWLVAEYAAAALYFAERLIYLPLGIFATALGTVLLPTFSTHTAKKGSGGEAFGPMRATLDSALRGLLFVMIPAAVGLVVLADPIIEVLLGWGKFGEASVGHTALALRWYAPGLIVFSLAKVFVPAFYSMQDMLTPVKIAAGCVLLNIALSFLFVWTWPEGTKHAGLACGTVLSQLVYSLMLGRVLRRRIGFEKFGEALSSGLRAATAAVVMGVVAWFAWAWLSGLLGEAKVARAAALAGSMGLAVAAYAAVAWGLRCREVRELVAAVRRR